MEPSHQRLRKNRSSKPANCLQSGVSRPVVGTFVGRQNGCTPFVRLSAAAAAAEAGQ